MAERSYLDHAATTPLRVEAIEAITTELNRVGNPSSLHAAGRAARRVVEESRERIAACVGAEPAEVIFTSGATEADNLAVTGAFRARQNAERIVCSAIEHHAVLDTALALGDEGAKIDLIDADTSGRIDMAAMQAALESEPATIALVSIMAANNETGVIQPVHQIAELAHRAGVPVHSDAVQALGSVPIEFADSGLDALSISAHKVGGPVGVGALVARRDCPLTTVQHGGAQERDVRSGTLDVAAIAGFAAAVQATVADREETTHRIRRLRDRLIAGARTAVDDVEINGMTVPEQSLPGIANLWFPGCVADDLLLLLDQAGIDCSVGSACTAGVSRPSHVLEAMGRDRQAAESLRFSLGHDSSDADVARLLDALPEAVSRARAANPSRRTEPQRPQPGRSHQDSK
jgi:cysteine desulfurase